MDAADAFAVWLLGDSAAVWFLGDSAAVWLLDDSANTTGDGSGGMDCVGAGTKIEHKGESSDAG